jgi:hypothetical protein
MAMIGVVRIPINKCYVLEDTLVMEDMAHGIEEVDSINITVSLKLSLVG